MLQHRRFQEVFPRVYRPAGLALTHRGLIAAAALSLPSDAHVSHLTRFALDGLDVGDGTLHFSIGRELHLAIDGIMLHRTVRLPRLDVRGISVAASFVQSASLVSPLRLVTIGDWLRRAELLDIESVRAVALRDPWRPGADAIDRVVGWLDARSRSLPESEVRVLMRACGLPETEPNGPIELGDTTVVGDLVLRPWRVVVEYEGRQHAESRRQFAWDVERYEALRATGWEYVQVTARRLASPRALMTRIHRTLRQRGYDGPPPRFGAEWEWLMTDPPPLGRPRKVVIPPFEPLQGSNCHRTAG